MIILRQLFWDVLRNFTEIIFPDTKSVSHPEIFK
jgi:hypothetical protein